ncbi:MAG: 30S ribosomal protein S3ae [Candidatus Thermoplasmatota archaeon]|jgi:small subunit ribosomal protein S3Ae|nr:30S ribosomal protein S3ae [Candidatus Thermoplasmatota archaeon]MCL5984398.1 30S ribosomal protein S3ae [Candidatus Thermoplasmatota archaeon]
MAKEKEGSEKKAQKGRTIKDKWKLKEWYKIRAPSMFQNADLGESPAEEPEKLLGRIAEVTFNEVSGGGDPNTSHIKLKFKIVSIGDNHVATTKFVGHEFTSDYIRRLARRKRSKIDLSFPVTTKDGVVFTVKPLAVSEHRLQTRLKAMLRQKIHQVMTEEAAQRSGAEMVKDMLNGEISKAITKGLSPLYPLKKIDIRASAVEGEIPEAPAPPEHPAEETPVTEPVTEEPVAQQPDS